MNINNEVSAAFSKEEIILHAVKTVLTAVIRDTAVGPGMIHPFHEATREKIRDCFVLITERTQELSTLAGRPSTVRPHFKDETRTQSEVIVPLASLKKRLHSDQED